MDRAVSVGEGRAEMLGSAGKGSGREARVMVEAVGLMGVTGRSWAWYQLKTGEEMGAVVSTGRFKLHRRDSWGFVNLWSC